MSTKGLKSDGITPGNWSIVDMTRETERYPRVYLVTDAPYSGIRGHRFAIIIGETAEEARATAEFFLSAWKNRKGDTCD